MVYLGVQNRFLPTRLVPSYPIVDLSVISPRYPLLFGVALHPVSNPTRTFDTLDTQSIRDGYCYRIMVDNFCLPPTRFPVAGFSVSFVQDFPNFALHEEPFVSRYRIDLDVESGTERSRNR